MSETGPKCVKNTCKYGAVSWKTGDCVYLEMPDIWDRLLTEEERALFPSEDDMVAYDAFDACRVRSSNGTCLCRVDVPQVENEYSWLDRIENKVGLKESQRERY